MGQRLIHPVTDAHFGNAMRFPDACVRAFSVYICSHLSVCVRICLCLRVGIHICVVCLCLHECHISFRCMVPTREPSQLQLQIYLM